MRVTRDNWPRRTFVFYIRFRPAETLAWARTTYTFCWGEPRPYTECKTGWRWQLRRLSVSVSVQLDVNIIVIVLQWLKMIGGLWRRCRNVNDGMMAGGGVNRLYYYYGNVTARRAVECDVRQRFRIHQHVYYNRFTAIYGESRTLPRDVYAWHYGNYITRVLRIRTARVSPMTPSTKFWWYSGVWKS